MPPAPPLGEVLPQTVEPYVLLMLAGFVIGVYGHLARLRWVVALGIILVLLATVLFPVAINLFGDEPELPPGPRVYSP